MPQPFKSLKELLAYAEKQANSVLKKETAETVVRTMQDKIQEEIYDVYEPKVYERQGYSGGLIDRDNIEVEVLGDNRISVENIRFDGDREVAEIVETGLGYQYSFPYAGKPRPFTEATRVDLASSDKLKESMKQGLFKRGIKTE
jgi:hypothetical protein